MLGFTCKNLALIEQADVGVWKRFKYPDRVKPEPEKSIIIGSCCPGAGRESVKGI